ncbi:hypothetical protein [Thalassobellus suaedae]|uniref:DUF998 domain-containing protein n=1 Tax=Thalassobellus suaedae TaxID=3074124 RepID=A0ABY9XWB2_9FLAO|nr:hypothetical protein RHP51_06060 [Flavobacteriaceae bacterium HL-DH14]
MKLLITKSNLLAVLFTILAASFLLAFSYYFSVKFQIPLEAMTADPMSTFDAHPFIGLISNLGVLLWCTTASICFFAGFYLRQKKHNKEGLFLISNGVITSALLLDDFFMMHEYLFYTLQLVFYGVYLIGFIWYCYHFIRLIFLTEFIILGLAFAFLGASVFIDVVFPNVGFEYFIEDGFKFLGICTWMLYFVRTSYKMIIAP